MLYRTHHHPFVFPFNPFTSSSNSSFPLISSPPPPLLQVGEQMECVEGALKSSLKPEMAVKTAQNMNNNKQDGLLMEDVWAVNGQPGDDFSVDDLLDFSNDLLLQPHLEEQVQEQQQQQEYNLNNNNNNNNVNKPSSQETFAINHLSLTDDFAPLSIPADDFESLEWLSHFVEDSFSEHSLSYDENAGKLAPIIKTEETRSEPETPVQEKAPFATPVQTKARTKRARAGMRVWSLGSSSLTESSSTSSSSSTSTTSSSPLNNPWVFVCSDPVQNQTAESVKPPAKKPKRKVGNDPGAAQQPRRCSHCGVQKTPQWRAGPLGAKTLCNACGVRYKSGRLLPEYRPACSPTFSSELHSNNHRKVLEMRRKKELGLIPPVQSF